MHVNLTAYKEQSVNDGIHAERENILTKVALADREALHDPPHGRVARDQRLLQHAQLTVVGELPGEITVALGWIR